MATYYVKSTATGANNGSSWVDAFTELSSAAAVDLAGDTVYVSKDHVSAVATTSNWAGTANNPVKIICVDDTGSPVTPTVVSFTGTELGSQTGSVHIFGIVFSPLTGGIGFVHAGGRVLLDSCEIRLNTTDGASRLSLSGQGNSQNSAVVKLKKTLLSFRSPVQGFDLRGGRLSMEACAFRGDTTAVTGLFFTGSSNNGNQVLVDACDFSLAATSFTFFKSTQQQLLQSTIRNCKLPSGWVGGLHEQALGIGAYVSMYNCDSGDTNYRLWLSSYSGTVKDETSVVRTGGASDGITPISWRIQSNTNANASVAPLVTDEIVVWNDTVGTAKTVTIEVLTDGVTLKDDECWLEVQYLGTSGYPLGVFASDAKADVLATAANQATSTETWTTTGLTTPVKQKLSVTFTPQEKGFVHAKVMLAKPSTTVYVCPKASVT